MKITIELDVNLKIDEATDFIDELSNDLSNGDTINLYDFSIIGWDWKE